MDSGQQIDVDNQINYFNVNLIYKCQYNISVYGHHTHNA